MPTAFDRHTDNFCHTYLAMPVDLVNNYSQAWAIVSPSYCPQQVSKRCMNLPTRNYGDKHDLTRSSDHNNTMQAALCARCQGDDRIIVHQHLRLQATTPQLNYSSRPNCHAHQLHFCCRWWHESKRGVCHLCSTNLWCRSRAFSMGNGNKQAIG